MSEVPLIDALDARIAIDGVVAIDRLTLSTRGAQVLFAGDPSALVAAITGVPLSSQAAAREASLPRSPGDADALPGEAHVMGGKLLLAGRSVAEGAHLAAMGAAPFDPPLPPKWTAEEYVAWGARLGGAPRRAARDLARAALGRVGLLAARARVMTQLSLPERRALVLAQAVVLSPEVLIAEAPLSGLEGAAASFVRAALTAVIDGRRAVVTARRIDPGSPEGELAQRMSYLVLLAGGEVALEGAPGELYAGARIYSVTVHHNAAPLRAELAALGIDLAGGPLRFSAKLPAGRSTRDILRAAQAVKATVIELVPVLG